MAKAQWQLFLEKLGRGDTKQPAHSRCPGLPLPSSQLPWEMRHPSRACQALQRSQDIQSFHESPGPWSSLHILSLA